VRELFCPEGHSDKILVFCQKILEVPLKECDILKEIVFGEKLWKKIIVFQVTFRKHLGITNNSVIEPWITQ